MAYEDNGEDRENHDSPEDSGGESALIPKSALSDKCKPGDVVTMKVVHVYDDEVEVEYMSKKHKDEESDDEMANAEGELDGMATMEA